MPLENTAAGPKIYDNMIMLKRALGRTEPVECRFYLISVEIPTSFRVKQCAEPTILFRSYNHSPRVIEPTALNPWKECECNLKTLENSTLRKVAINWLLGTRCPTTRSGTACFIRSFSCWAFILICFFLWVQGERDNRCGYAKAVLALTVVVLFGSCQGPGSCLCDWYIYRDMGHSAS